MGTYPGIGTRLNSNNTGRNRHTLSKLFKRVGHQSESTKGQLAISRM